MSKYIDVSLILPAFNEAGRIQETIAQAVAYLRSRGYKYEIIVAADGCDGTRELVRELGKEDPCINVIGHPERLGKGRGIREAVALAKGRFIGYADADNKVPIQEFDKIVPGLEHGYPIVIGSRALSESRIDKYQPFYRRLGSKGFSVFMHVVVGLANIPDTQCGFKFFTNESAKLIFGTQQIDGYMFDVEVLVLAQRFGFSIQQVPIIWKDDGDSRLELVAGNIRNVRDIFRIRFSSAKMAPIAAKSAVGAGAK